MPILSVTPVLPRIFIPSDADPAGSEVYRGDWIMCVSATGESLILHLSVSLSRMETDDEVIGRSSANTSIIPRLRASEAAFLPFC